MRDGAGSWPWWSWAAVVVGHGHSIGGAAHTARARRSHRARSRPGPLRDRWPASGRACPAAPLLPDAGVVTLRASTLVSAARSAATATSSPVRESSAEVAYPGTVSSTAAGAPDRPARVRVLGAHRLSAPHPRRDGYKPAAHPADPGSVARQQNCGDHARTPPRNARTSRSGSQETMPGNAGRAAMPSNVVALPAPLRGAIARRPNGRVRDARRHAGGSRRRWSSCTHAATVSSIR